MGKKSDFLFRFMPLINEQILNEMVYEIQLVFSCVSTRVSTHHHIVETEKCV